MHNTGVLPAWREVELPDVVSTVPTMLMKTEQQLLFALARDYFKNEGHIIDAGCFLGGSTIALGTGLLQNEHFKAAPRKGVITSYDLFKVEAYTVPRFFPEGTPLGQSFEADYRRNIEVLGDVVEVRPGDVTQSGTIPQPIEILFIDLAKNVAVNDYVVRNFFPALIPGHSIVVQQDYGWNIANAWIHATMEHYAEYFEPIDATINNSVVFLYAKPIPPQALPANLIGGLRRSQVVDLQDRAVKRITSRFPGDRLAGLLRESQADLTKRLHQWPE